MKIKNNFLYNYRGWIIVVFIIVALLLFLILRYGFLQWGNIDDKDLSYWEYDENGVMVDASEFSYLGNNNTCWLLIHSYCSTPFEMRVLGNTIYDEFNDTVVAIRLKGHGEVPSHTMNLSLTDWYIQVSADLDLLNENCDSVNVVGSSLGGALAIRLSEEKNFWNLYLLNAYIEPTYKWYYGFKLNQYLRVLAPLVHYSKKIDIANINSEEGRARHIAYWNFPYVPIRNSEDFLKESKENLDKIDENLLVVHSVNDKVAFFDTAKELFDVSSSESKLLIELSKSNHVLLMDYDEQVVIDSIIDFEKMNRK